MKLMRNQIGMANAVLGLIESSACEDNDELFHLEMYSNCREQGYCIKGWHDGLNFGCSFSENRNSDDIVVYLYIGKKYNAFSQQGNVPREDLYRGRIGTSRWFDSIDKAAKFIQDNMKEFSLKEAMPEEEETKLLT